jgi:hypothetical protein
MKMMRKLVRGSWLCLLGLALASLSVGCEEANESEFKEGSPGGKGVADAKYTDTPEAYKQFHEDAMKKKVVPVKAAPAKGKAAAAAPPASQKQP